MKEDASDLGSIGKLCATVRETLAFRQVQIRHEVIRQLHSCMRQQGVDQKLMAERSGISQAELCRLFSGDHPFTLDRLVALAHATDSQVEVRLIPNGQKTVSVRSATGEESTPAQSEMLFAADPVLAVPSVPESDIVTAHVAATMPKPEPDVDRAAEPLAAAEPYLDSMPSTAVMDETKDEDRLFLEAMQTALQREKRTQQQLEQHPEKTEKKPPKKPWPSIGLVRESEPPVAENAESGLNGMPLEGTGEENQIFLKEKRAACQMEAQEQETAAEASDAEADLDTMVVLAAIEEMSGADQSFMQELWAEVQSESGKHPQDHLESGKT